MQASRGDLMDDFGLMGLGSIADKGGAKKLMLRIQEVIEGVGGFPPGLEMWGVTGGGACRPSLQVRGLLGSVQLHSLAAPLAWNNTQQRATCPACHVASKREVVGSSIT